MESAQTPTHVLSRWHLKVGFVGRFGDLSLTNILKCSTSEKWSNLLVSQQSPTQYQIPSRDIQYTVVGTQKWRESQTSADLCALHAFKYSNKGPSIRHQSQKFESWYRYSIYSLPALHDGEVQTFKVTLHLSSPPWKWRLYCMPNIGKVLTYVMA